MAKRYWLMKSEPTVYSIGDLERDGSTSWDGVRNYQARNFMRDEMQVGDLVLFYHSNADPSGVAGLAKVSGGPRADPTQFDADSELFDAASTSSAPRWVSVTVAFVERFVAPVSLAQLKAEKKLAGMAVTRPGQRLSVQPVDAAHFAQVLKLAKAQAKL